MKFVHLADLHIGKRLGGYSLLADQKYVFEQILRAATQFAPDGILIAGDVFDRSVPAEDAVDLYEWLITELTRCAPIFIIAGNHDSGKRLALFSELLADSRVHICGSFTGAPETIRLQGEHACADITLLPYIEPGDVRPYFPEADINSYEDAVRTALSAVPLGDATYNILLTHQFYLNRKEDRDTMISGSERLIVGGLDDVSVSVLKDYDYAALGHIHGMQQVGEHARYCGTPLKYALNEKGQEKALNLITVDKEGVQVQAVPLTPLHELRTVTGTLEELAAEGCPQASEDYVEIILTDLKAVPGAVDKLTPNFKNLLSCRYAGISEKPKTTQSIGELLDDPLEMLASFYEFSGKSLDDTARTEAQKVLATVQKDMNAEAGA